MFDRILNSKKAGIALITLCGNFVAQLSEQFTGAAVDPTQGLLLIWNGLGGSLLGLQGLLDLRWGSTSDSTGPDTLEALLAEVDEEPEA